MTRPASQGIVCLALEKLSYARMAYNLAACQRAMGARGLPVVVLIDEKIASRLPGWWEEPFKEIKLLKHKHLYYPEKAKLGANAAHFDTWQPDWAKLFLLEYSPFDHTLYLDVDTCWIRKRDPRDFFSEFYRGIRVVSDRQTEEEGDFIWTMDLHEARKYIPDIKRVGNCNGTGLAFSRESKDFFEEIKEWFDRVYPVHAMAGWWLKNNTMPIELPMWMAHVASGYYPPKWEPFAGQKQVYIEGMDSWEKLEAAGYYLMSPWGDLGGDKPIRLYNEWAKENAELSGLRFLPWAPKQEDYIES